MMINLTPGITASVWLSLEEDLPVSVSPTWKFDFTHDISGATKTFYPGNLNGTNKWQRFNLLVGTPENLSRTISGTVQPVIDLRPGMWSYQISAGGQVLETGKVLVNESKTWTTLTRPAKTIPVLKR